MTGHDLIILINLIFDDLRTFAFWLFLKTRATEVYFAYICLEPKAEFHFFTEVGKGAV